MTREEELLLLKAKAQAIGTCLDLLRQSITDIKHEPETTRHIAIIDTERCLGCGRCVDACP